MLKLIGFKHMDAAYIENNFLGLACGEGSMGLAFDLKRQTIVDAVVDPSKRAVVISRAKMGDKYGDELLIEFDDEVQDLVLHLPMMFNVGVTSLHWCFQCKNVSTTQECGCPERRGITNINWDGFGPEQVFKFRQYEIHIQSLKPIIVKDYCGTFTCEDIIRDITTRYKVYLSDQRFGFLFDSLRKFGIPALGETIKFAYERRTIGSISCRN